ncbi:TPA: cupin domain-containing protein [Candidatus Woesearchaeota archaeon]|nr:cupin domain-containing protein [Candidatus Woesearchaeota archaeon]
MDGVKIERLSPAFSDERGVITDILSGEMRNIGIITQKKGVVRGNHYHKAQTQYTYILKGKIEMTTKDLSEPGSLPKTAIIREGDLITHPAMVAHAYLALEDAVFLAITTKRRDEGGYEDDTFRIEMVKQHATD